MGVADSNADEMLAHYAEQAIEMVESTLNDQVAAAKRALGELEKIKKLDPSYVPGEVRRTLQWAKPNNGFRDGIVHALESLAFWYGVKKAQDEAAQDEDENEIDFAAAAKKDDAEAKAHGMVSVD